jgi:hypothetical protein
LFNFSKTLKQSLDQVPFQIFLSPSLLTYVIDDGAEWSYNTHNGSSSLQHRGYFVYVK